MKRLFCNQKVVPYIFIAPFVLYFLLVYLYPLISTVLLSFQKVDSTTGEVVFSTTNYQKIFMMREFKQALINTFSFTLWDVLILVPVPLLLAVLIHSGAAKAPNFFKSLLFIPSLTSVIVAGIVFRLAFGELEGSIANQVRWLFGLPPIAWLRQLGTSNFVLILLTLWRWMGVNIVYYYSGLQSIPADLYEAASIDGANTLSKFIHITLPGVKPVLIYVLTLTVMGGLSMFTESVALWQQKNPGNIGLTIVGYLYKTGIQKNNLAMASAVGLVLLILVVVVNLIQLALMGFFKKED